MLETPLFLARAIYQLLRQRTRQPRQTELLAGVADRGYAVIPDYKSAEWCAAAAAQLPFTDPLIASQTQEDTRIFGAEKVGALARELGRDAQLNAFASAYAGGDESLIFCMANDVGPSKAYGSGGEWHRDGFRHELKALLYLTDVSEADGPFALVPRSHHTLAILRDTARVALGGKAGAMPTRLKDFGDGRAHTFTAKAGTLILFDTSCIHAGLPVRAGGRRLALTNYYGSAASIAANLAYYRQHVKLN